MSDDDEGANAYHLRTFARDVAVPQCWLYKPGVKRNPTSTLGSIAVPSWPLPTETLAALATTYAGRVPAKDVVFHGFYDITRHEVMAQSYLLGQLDPEQGEYDEPLEFGKTLAHFAIDTTGDASTLTPATMQAPPHTFATVVYFFPSNCVGGAVTISLGHRTTTYEALDGRFLSFYNTCDVTVIPSRRDTGLLPFGPKARFTAPPLPSIQELQVAARNYARNDAIAVTIGLETRSLTPTFDSLVSRDKAVVDLLLVADVFDIALARGGICNDKNEDAWPRPETCHPLCKTPTSVRRHEYDGCFLLVWPKARRLRILGYGRTIALLRANVDGDVTEHLGYGSLQGLFEAAFRFFYPHSWIDYGGDPEQDTYAMASVDHGDVELIEAFMDIHDHWADDESMANWLLTVLRRFGAARFQHKLHMVKAASAFAAHLVHLAATGDTLAHSVAFDCIPLWWPRMLRDLTSSDCSTKKEELVNLFGIETYLLEHPIDVATSTYLHEHLPDVVVHKVAAYLTPPLGSLLDTVRADKCLVNNLPAVLWPQRDSLGRVRLATCVDLAVEYLRSGAERASCYNGHVLYLALLTAGTPAFATADADVQMRRRCFDFKSECVCLDKTKLTPLQALVLEEYLRRPTYGCL
ncbi:hypothetical protein SPRG_11984 [Saprolegnia parasitica CBS 223.65]|uniref:Uncharacterized protein n=1 Tax=Saprolegnia parasitica (strain CBS 223.65) TaxID=695850 RepID=A0A067C7R0_SAPPC|nr:hypothetical protein SPRG_11984 [Saprolegnia parasitica CBS 223.65]KDO22847.1 hypothetical protein SPRG_11984 [Saprolegnia parasitica CBS 223.65]|eukprot:XP_012206404.1 hypothetical protein SPRG_11984 [Saprolegnia parasitica CBS 223.65]